ncbi:MAG TPA: T9SS type A sorting domain-containing protein [Chryseosolibacter sp.]|jgi:hypothetical protein|nr:T9SS type A sorting domain-containing protein [Chryseosolibacter sp.]
MNKLHFLAACLLTYVQAFAQNPCTVTGGSPLFWSGNGSGISCAEGGNAVGKSSVIIPAGFTVTFDDGSDTWTGPAIQVYGTLNFFANPTTTINSSLVVNGGGLVNITGKLALGSGTPGCAYNLIIRSGGKIDVASTGSDRLTVCGTEIMKGAGGCNDCGGTNSGQCPYAPQNQPYCEPTGGFTGPSGYDDGGFDATLPVKLMYLLAEAKDEKVSLFWATSAEENFYKFIVQRSVDGTNFEDIGEVNGKGFNIYGTETEYSFVDDRPNLGYNYYRLKAIDLDETYEYFGVKAVKVQGTKAVSVFPNPVSGRTIYFETNFSAQESDRVVLTNQFGAEIFNAAANGLGDHIVLGEAPAAGIYVLRYVGEDFEKTARVIIKN